MGEQAFIDRAEETILTVVIAEMATTGCRMKINPDLATVGFTSSSPSAPDDAQT